MIVESVSNVTVLSGKQPDDVLINASQCVRYDNALIRKVAYTVAIIVTVCNNTQYAFVAVVKSYQWHHGYS